MKEGLFRPFGDMDEDPALVAKQRAIIAKINSSKHKPRKVEDLATRRSGGMEVSLLWNRETDRVTVAVDDPQDDNNLRTYVSREDAMDAFNHPFAYHPSSFTGRTAIKGVETSADQKGKAA